MSDGIWHTVIPITDEHVFLHLLRAVWVHHHYPEKGHFSSKEFIKSLREWNRLPSPYLKISRKMFFRSHIKPTPLGLYYSDYVNKFTKKLDEEIYGHFYYKDRDGISKKIPNASARFKEKLPLILHYYGFSSRADYLVKWSIFRGALARIDAPLELGQNLGIFDQLSRGISSRKEADKTVCLPVEELI